MHAGTCREWKQKNIFISNFWSDSHLEQRSADLNFFSKSWVEVIGFPYVLFRKLTLRQKQFIFGNSIFDGTKPGWKTF